jgi:predicted enzyme related to lactoylglutathione lyase
MGMPNRVVHFEIEATDRERATRFYSQAFGWQMQETGPEMGHYVVVTTGDPKEPGGINGGIYTPLPGQSKELNAYSCVVGVENLERAIQSVKSAGGELIGDKQDIPGVGLWQRCKDTEGNIFSILQPPPGSAA